MYSCLAIPSFNGKVFAYGVALCCIEVIAYYLGEMTDRYSYLTWFVVWFYTIAYCIKARSFNLERMKRKTEAAVE